MSNTQSAKRDDVDSDYLYSVYLVFRWATLTYAFAILVFMPYSLPRTGPFYWYVLGTLLAWNTVVSGIVPLVFKDKRSHPAIMTVDVLISAGVVLVGGGQGNVLLMYSLSSVIFVGLTYGTAVAMCPAILNAAFYLASLWLPPHTISRLVFGGKGIDIILSHSLVQPLAAFLSGYLRKLGKRIGEATDEENRSQVLFSASRERLVLLGDVNGRLRKVLRSTSVELEQFKMSLVDNREMASDEQKFVLSMEKVAEKLQAWVEESRSWLKSVRDKTDQAVFPAYTSELHAPGSGTHQVQGQFTQTRAGVDKVILTLIFAYRFAALVYAFILILMGTTGSAKHGVVLFAAAASYNLLLAFLLMPDDSTTPALSVAVIDLAVTFLLLFISGGKESIFFIYAYATPVLISLYFGLWGAIIGSFALSGAYAVALYANGFPQGYLRSVGDARNIYDSTFQFTLDSVAIYIVIDIYRRLVAEKQRAWAARSAAMRLEERLRIARQVHDGVVQTVASLALRSTHLAQKLEEDIASEEVVQRLDSLRRLVENSIAETDEADDQGLGAAKQFDVKAVLEGTLGDMRARVGPGLVITTELTDAKPMVRGTHELKAAFSEILRNIEKHSGARTVSVEANADDSLLRVVFTDDGRGFNTPEPSTGGRDCHFGLIGLKESADIFGGSINVASEPGRGTKVIVTVPVVG